MWSSILTRASRGLHLTERLSPIAVSKITLSGVTARLMQFTTSLSSADQVVVPTWPFNVIAQSGSSDPISYALNFALSQVQFSMSRTAVHPGSTGDALPEWHAYAYDGSGNLLSSVG